ncbi:MAG: GNAT family N-acetyltransferase [Pseudolabrys sp.]
MSLATFAALDATPRTAGGPSLTLVEGADAIWQVEAAWRELCGNGGASSAFQSFDVAVACAAAHAARGEVPRIVLARRSGRATVIVPLVVTELLKCRVLRFLGDPLIQYGDVIAAPDADGDDIVAAWALAASPEAGALAFLRRVRDDARLSPHLGWQAAEIATEESAVVDLRRDQVLPKNFVRELRRTSRRLNEQGKVDIHFYRGPKTKPLAAQAIALKRQWLDERGLASAVIGNPVWERAIEEMSVRGALAGAALLVDGRLAAAELALVDGACWYAFMGAFEKSFARMGPGQVLTEHILAGARDQGLAFYDPLPPAQSYKRIRATETIRVRDFALPLRPSGNLLAAAARLRPHLKAAFNGLSPAIRKTALSMFGR